MTALLKSTIVRRWTVIGGLAGALVGFKTLPLFLLCIFGGAKSDSGITAFLDFPICLIGGAAFGFGLGIVLADSRPRWAKAIEVLYICLVFGFIGVVLFPAAKNDVVATTTAEHRGFWVGALSGLVLEILVWVLKRVFMKGAKRLPT